MEQYQTWQITGSIEEQRSKSEEVEAFMKTQGFSVIWAHVRVEGKFMVFYKEEK